MPKRQTLFPALAVCLCVVSSGCVARRRVITRDGKSTPQQLQTATRADLERRISEQFQAINDFNATVDMVPALGTTEKSKITEYKDVRGYVLFRKPTDIRIIGLYPVVRSKAVDMVSTGSNFSLYVPAKNLFITGRNDIATHSENKIENWRPQHFLEALIVHPPDTDEKPMLMNYTDEDNAAYILALIHEKSDGLHISRSVWFDRLNLRIARQLIFDDGGNILTDARYSQWQVYDGVPFPKQIVLNRPQDEYSVVITVVKMDINKGVKEEQFALQQPEGSQLRTLSAQGLSPAAQPVSKKTQ